uniref:RRP12 N-terminal HEAT domain-containing protein n=1 Tax=Aegilops tauschii subsp. strangulata TaxID=200361 RepID=A0A453PTF1_AEGTS
SRPTKQNEPARLPQPPQNPSASYPEKLRPRAPLRRTPATATMADVDMEELPQTPRSVAGDDPDLSLFSGEADLAAAILARLSASRREDDQHLCATTASLAQTVRESGLPTSTVAYFGAAAA